MIYFKSILAFLRYDSQNIAQESFIRHQQSIFHLTIVCFEKRRGVGMNYKKSKSFYLKYGNAFRKIAYMEVGDLKTAKLLVNDYFLKFDTSENEGVFSAENFKTFCKQHTVYKRNFNRGMVKHPELEIAMATFLQQMPFEKRAPFCASCFEGKSIEEISKKLNMAHETVLKRIIEVLSELYEHFYEKLPIILEIQMLIFLSKQDFP